MWSVVLEDSGANTLQVASDLLRIRDFDVLSGGGQLRLLKYLDQYSDLKIGSTQVDDLLLDIDVVEAAVGRLEVFEELRRFAGRCKSNHNWFIAFYGD